MTTRYHEIPNQARNALTTGDERDARAAILLGQLCDDCNHLRIRHKRSAGCNGGDVVELESIGQLPIFEIKDSDCECQESQISILEKSVEIFTHMNMNLCESIHRARRFAEHAMDSKANYAVMKEGRKNALRVKGLDGYDKAWLWAAENGYVIDGKLAEGISIQLRRDDRRYWNEQVTRTLRVGMVEAVFLNALKEAL